MTRCSITCAEPGCNEKIYYTVADAMKSVGFDMRVDKETDVCVPLYCGKHRSVEGRHAQVRVVNAKKYYGKGTNQDTEREYP